MIEEIRNPRGEKLDFRLHPAGQPLDPSHLVLIGHGVTANLDRPFVRALAEGLAEAGASALRFSYSGNGSSEGRFQDSCVTKEVDDLGVVIDAAERSGFSVSYAGHSMGGAVGVIRSAMDPRIRRLITLAGMVRTLRFAETEFGDTKPDEGFMWDDPDCPLSSDFMRDLRRIESVAGKIRDVHVPVLIVHGADDDLVPVDEGRELYEMANQPKKLVELAGSNHVFAGEATPRMVAAVIDWLRPQLAPVGR